MIGKFSFRAIFIFLFYVEAAGLLFAQADNSPITYGTYRTIHSKVLGEDRTLLIRLPYDYETSDKKYPVLFKLDGETDVFLQTASVINYLVDMTDKVPDQIVVGIANTDRNRDMRTDREAAKFVRFLKTEAVPFVDQNYRTNGFRVLCGQSLSAVFTLYSFLKEPALFDGYVLSSFGVDRTGTSQLAQELKNATLQDVSRRYLFTANGTEDSYDPDGSRARLGTQFLDSLKRSAPPNVLFRVRAYEGEGHVPFPTIYDALQWIYAEEKVRTK